VNKGESITLTPRLYHTFGAVEGKGDLLVGEVSSINDDTVDNHFAEDMKRFSQIEEDVPLKTPLLNEYKRVLLL
jgi:D-lyxose ketol-isomerase